MIFICELIFVSLLIVFFIVFLYIIYDVFFCYILMEKMVYFVNRIKYFEVFIFVGKWKVVNLFFVFFVMKFILVCFLIINMVGCFFL